MTTKERVFDALRAAGGDFISGEELAERLSVSRAAVWKAIRALRASGAEIEAVTNRGYALKSEGDVLSSEAVTLRLRQEGLRVEYAPVVTGTNAILKQRAAQGAPEGTVLIAAAQTAGRGRYGRDFYSPEGTGLYMSLILRPGRAAREAQLITCLAAVAAARAVEHAGGREVKIKWVNDLLISGKKVCGILTEGALDLETGGLDYAVLGLGFNLADPPEGWGGLSGIAGSIFGPSAPNMKRAELAAEFLNEFWPMYLSFSPADFLPEYRARQAAIGRRVEVIGRDAAREAVAVDVDGEFRLVVEYPGGSREALSAGEVRILLGGSK